MANGVSAARQQAVHATGVSPDAAEDLGAADQPGLRTESGRVGTLRGATVSFNPRRLVQGVLGLVMATLAITAIVLTVAGVHSNDQINRLHTQGQPVTVTVSGCLGLLGGSGSNAAGYSCRGSYQLDEHVYRVPLPGSTFYKPGTAVPSIAVPGDPALVSPVDIVNAQQASRRRIHRADRPGHDPSRHGRRAAREEPSEAPGRSERSRPRDRVERRHRAESARHSSRGLSARASACRTRRVRWIASRTTARKLNQHADEAAVGRAAPSSLHASMHTTEIFDLQTPVQRCDRTRFLD